MDLGKLRLELTADPQGLGYAAMTDLDAATALNAVNRTRNRRSITSTELYEALNLAEYRAFTSGMQKRLDVLLGLGAIQVGPSSRGRSELLNLFPNGTTTRSSLLAVVQETVSRSTELGMGLVNEGDVTHARVG